MTSERDQEMQARIRRARGHFAAMAGAYALGVFNDNFFKQAAILLAQYHGSGWLKGVAAAIFALPYMIFPAWAGWLADRFVKRRVVIGAKGLELAAMVCGAAGVWLGPGAVGWVLMLAMIGLMGLQSCIFSPALNGALPELYPREYVPVANGILKAATTVAILLGIATAGHAIAPRAPAILGIPWGRLIVGVVVLAVAGAGLLLSFGVPERPAAAPGKPFPWSGPLETVRELNRIRNDPLLFRIVAANALVWGIGSLEVLTVAALGHDELHVNEAVTGNLMFAEMFGIAAGALLVAALSRKGPPLRLLGPAAAALGASSLACLAIPHVPGGQRVMASAAILFLMGASGGMILVPCESFIQVRPKAEKRGSVIAAANFAAFGVIILAGIASSIADHYIAASTFLAGLGALGFPLAWWFRKAVRETPPEDSGA